ncbi:MAG: hypothetical protein CM1200mP35_02880 [Chloroflexota bacterium]|nr:MAG: hypothetical protein CM1200mP35_02880 [Chloroflexota bacterium]
MANKKGTALLMVFVDIDTEQDADFNKWYNEEHIPDLLALPGFLNGARYEASKGGPRYLACYELETAETLKTRNISLLGNIHRNGRRGLRSLLTVGIM